VSKLGGRPLDERPLPEAAIEPAAGTFSDSVLKRAGLANHGGLYLRVSEHGEAVTAKTLKARAELAEHLGWIDNEMPDQSAERVMATAHALSLHIDDLHPVQDADTIATGRELLRAVYGE
jgi:hypothetical protein